jgi:hypothetical protein
MKVHSQSQIPADSATEKGLLAPTLWIGGWVVPNDVLDMTVGGENKNQGPAMNQVLATQVCKPAAVLTQTS